jgi:hypothetical protein
VLTAAAVAGAAELLPETHLGQLRLQPLAEPRV